MLLAAVRLMHQHIWWLKVVPPQWTEHASSLLQEVVVVWQLIDERAREREREEEALFHYKEKVHEARDEEEGEVQKKLFPSFESEFEPANAVDEEEMEVEAGKEKKDSAIASRDADPVPAQLCPEEMVDVVLAHSQVTHLHTLICTCGVYRGQMGCVCNCSK